MVAESTVVFTHQISMFKAKEATLHGTSRGNIMFLLKSYNQLDFE